MAVNPAWRWGVGCVALGLTVAGCERDRNVASKDTTVPPAAEATGTASAPPACPPTGHWTPCQVRYRLDRAGVAPQPDSSTDALPALGPKPTTLLVGTSRLAIYLFPDSASRSSAARTLDSTMFVPPSAALSMRGEATAIQNDNLLALLFSRRDIQRERVSDALMAGPPAP